MHSVLAKAVGKSQQIVATGSLMGRCREASGALWRLSVGLSTCFALHSNKASVLGVTQMKPQGAQTLCMKASFGRNGNASS